MQKQNSKKTIYIIIALVVAAAGVYFYTMGTPTDPDAGLTPDGVTSEADLVGTRVLTLLNQIKVLNVDAGFFKTAAYSSLVDHTVPIYEQSVGKSNPFYNPRPTAPASR